MRLDEKRAAPMRAARNVERFSMCPPTVVVELSTLHLTDDARAGRTRKQRAPSRRRATMLPCLAILVSLLAAGLAQAPATDDAGVRAALTHYLRGHATGDPSHMRKAFLPT